MQVTSILISAIEWPMRIRALDQQRVDGLKSSMDELGLINPITVYSGEDGELVLAAGAHRLKAAQALGWESIDAVVMDGDDVDRQLAEIDENLCRFELSPAQRALHMSRRKELWTAKQAAAKDTSSTVDAADPEMGGSNCATHLDEDHVEGGQGMSTECDADGRQLSPRHQPGFAASTAALTGDSKADINRSVHRGEALGDTLLDIAGTSLDKGVELDALTKLPTEEREDLTKRAKNGEKVSARKALEAKSKTPEDQYKGLAKRAVSALEKCAGVMDENEFGSALRGVKVRGIVARLAEEIAKHVG